MRICPLCSAEYDDTVEFCFKDGSPLDLADSAEFRATRLDDELAFRADESVEFLPPEATGLTAEFEPPDIDDISGPTSFTASAATDPVEAADGAEEDPDAGIEVVPGGLTSPLDDETIDGIDTDPFSTPISETILPPSDEQEAIDAPEAESLSGAAPPEADEPPAARADGTTEEADFASTAEAVELDTPPAPVGDDPAAADDDDPAAAAADDDDDAPPEDDTAAAGAAGEAAPAGAPADVEDAPADEPAAAADEDPDEEEDDDEAAAAGVAVTPAPLTTGYSDPLYDSIPPPAGKKRRGAGIWIALAIVAIVLLVAVVVVATTRGAKPDLPVEPGGAVQVDQSPEERAPIPPRRPPPGDASARPPGDPRPGEPPGDDGAVEPPTDPDAMPADPPLDGTADDRSPIDPVEPPTPAPVEPPTPAPVEPPTPAPVVDPTPPASDPWATGQPGTTATPGDPGNPWATGVPGATLGKVTVSSTPLGATFSVDGSVKGKTPLTVEVPYGPHTVRVELPGHVTQERPINVSAGTMFVDFSLKSDAPQSGKLTVFTNPEPGATLYVDGVARGTTPVTIEITPGQHTLRVELAGFPTRSETIDLSDLQPGENRRRTISMQ